MVNGMRRDCSHVSELQSVFRIPAWKRRRVVSRNTRFFPHPRARIAAGPRWQARPVDIS